MRCLLAVLLLTLPAAPTFAQEATSPSCAALFDAAGTRVGRVHGGVPTWVYFQVAQLPALLQVPASADALGGSTATLYYTDVEFEPLCEGTAYVLSDGPSPAWPETAVLDRTLYVRDPATNGELLVARSKLSVETGLCTRTTENRSLAPAVTFVDALPEFTPPFHVETEPCMSSATAPAVSLPYRIALVLACAGVATWLLRGRPGALSTRP